MATAAEAAAAASTMASAQAAGIALLSRKQKVTFRRYVRVVLPLDGFVFWVNASILADPAAQVKTGAGETLDNPTAPLVVEGSFHYSIIDQQQEDENFALNTITFTTQIPIQDFNSPAPNVLFIGEVAVENSDAGNPDVPLLRFAFSRQGNFYEAAGVYHYTGSAIYPDMLPQIIDKVSDLDLTNVVVSNSLPIWLTIASAAQPFWWPPRNFFPLFPSFLVPDNEPPPFAACHIDGANTHGLQSSMWLGRTYDAFQLASDRVKITFYGLRNDDVMDFVRAVNQYSIENDVLGIMGVPVVRDEKRTQNELGTLAMKKTVEFEVSYIQTRLADIARQLIESVVVTFTPGTSPT